MRIPNPTWERALRAPRGKHLSTEIELDDLVVVAADDCEISIGRNHDMLRLAETSKLVEILAILIEDLDAPIPPI